MSSKGPIGDRPSRVTGRRPHGVLRRATRRSRGWLPSRLVQLLNSRTAAARLIVAAACAAVLSLATACGSGATTPAAAPAAPATVADTAAQSADGHNGHGGMAGMGSTDLELYAVQTGTLGVVVTDGEGRVLYGSDADQTNPPQSHCTDACAQTWLPLTVPAGQEPAAAGRRRGGRRTPGPAGRQQPADAGRLAGLRQPQRRRPAQAGGPGPAVPGLVRDVPERGEGRAARLTRAGSSCPKRPVGDGGLPRTATARHVTRSAVFRSGDDQDGSEGNGAVIPRIACAA